ncbi:MAG: hypothetical protein ACTHWF_11010, partial [Brachybacterium sp.]
ELVVAGPEEVRAPGRLPPDAETGRLVDRGAPGRLLLMRRGYNLVLSFSQASDRVPDLLPLMLLVLLVLFSTSIRR